MDKAHAEFCLKRLKAMAAVFHVETLANYLLDDPRFIKWSGSGKQLQHHYGDYGLISHTYEVVFSCLKTKDLYPQYNIDKTELYLAALYHDAGKMWDYEKRNVSNKGATRGGGSTEDLFVEEAPEELAWTNATHKRMIHHVSRSSLFWQEAINSLGHDTQEVVDFKEKYTDPVLHAILSHHGQREWGSPVMPKSRVAWLLHLCDGISARLYDADTWDLTLR